MTKAAKIPFIQTFTVGGKAVYVKIVQNTNGDKGLHITFPGKAPYIIPAGIAGCAAGKDAWMRNVLVKCSECGVRTPCGRLEGNLMCPDCYEKAGEEIARMDGR
jgi:hypothetical protein